MADLGAVQPCCYWLRKLTKRKFDVRKIVNNKYGGPSSTLREMRPRYANEIAGSYVLDWYKEERREREL
jgi:uncharacterized protein YodC (DUF2158 family)